MGPIEKFRNELMANLLQGFNTLWEVWAVVMADPIDFFEASAWEAMLAALIAAGLAVGRRFIMDVTKQFKDFLLMKGAAFTNLFH